MFSTHRKPGVGRKTRFRARSWRYMEKIKIFGKIVHFWTFCATNVATSQRLSLCRVWGPRTHRTSLKVSLTLYSTLFDQIWVILTHFKWIRIFRISATGVAVLLIFSKNEQFWAKKSFFFEKNWKFIFFEKLNYPAKMHEIEVWWPCEVGLSFGRLRTHFKIDENYHIGALVGLVRSM